jgi:glycosyltransferase involved in cell wall biosynthesis
MDKVVMPPALVNRVAGTSTIGPMFFKAACEDDDARRLVKRIASNTSWFDLPDDEEPKVESTSLVDRSLLAAVLHCDAVVINGSESDLFKACLAKKLFGRKRLMLVAVDVILTNPHAVKSKIKTWVIRWLLREVDRLVLYFKDTKKLEAIYGIASDRIRHVPFKVNHFEEVIHYPTSDEGYFLACGRSNRDYETLVTAFEGLPYRLRILAQLGKVAIAHGTDYCPKDLPDNIHLVSDDGSKNSWLDQISRATAVILPILPDRLSPSGLSACLVSMALGKCVIITDSPATRGLVEFGEAVIVPPGDANAMRDAVHRVASDRQFRQSVAAKARHYAIGLKGEQRLARDVRRLVLELLMGRSPSPATEFVPA